MMVRIKYNTAIPADLKQGLARSVSGNCIGFSKTSPDVVDFRIDELKTRLLYHVRVFAVELEEDERAKE